MVGQHTSSLPRIALIGPSFFSYVDSIRSKIADRGFDVEFFDEKHSNSLLVKVAYRLGIYKVGNNGARDYLNSLTEKLSASRFDDVLLINVESPNREFILRLVEAGLRVHIYMWDSAINKPGFLEYIDLLQGKASFDPDDCDRLGLKYIPLFAEDVFSAKVLPNQLQQKNTNCDISFCGTLHSNRAKLISRLESFAKKNNLKIIMFLYFHAKWMFILKSIFSSSNFKFVSRISSKAFSKIQISDLFKSSKFVIDIPHPKQAGLTARTFEVLRSGSRLITFNSHANLLLPDSLSKRVHVIRKVEDLVKIEFTNLVSLEPLSFEDDYYLSLDRFVDDVLNLILNRTKLRWGDDLSKYDCIGMGN